MTQAARQLVYHEHEGIAPFEICNMAGRSVNRQSAYEALKRLGPGWHSVRTIAIELLKMRAEQEEYTKEVHRNGKLVDEAAHRLTNSKNAENYEKCLRQALYTKTRDTAKYDGDVPWFEKNEQTRKFRIANSGRKSNKRARNRQRERKEQRSKKDQDPLRKAKVEQAAINLVRERYEKHDWKVESRESCNLGWDLEATRDEERRMIEVKGRSGEAVACELTPNEFKAFSSRNSDYRLCIVVKALRSRPNLHEFRYDSSKNRWTTPRGRMLEVEELTGARCKS